jgi:hypothetical protein
MLNKGPHSLDAIGALDDILVHGWGKCNARAGP